MKKILLVILMALICVTVFTACDKSNDVLNIGTFEKGIDGWTKGDKTEVSDFSILDYNEYQGKEIPDSVDDGTVKGATEYFLRKNSSKVLKLGGATAVYNTFTSKVSVKQYSVYKLQCEVYIPVTHITDSTSITAVGFFCTVTELNGATPINVYEKSNGFQTLTFYFKTNDYNEVNVSFGIGNTVAGSIGSTYVDNISLTECTTPKNALVYSLGSDVSTVYTSSESGNVYLVLTVVLGTLFMAGITFLLIKSFKKKDVTIIDDKGTLANSQAFWGNPVTLLSGTLIISFAIRLILVNFVYGYVPFINSLSSVYGALKNFGLEYFSHDYPLLETGGMYLVWLLGTIAEALGVSQGSIGFSIFLKIPAIIADMAGIILIFYWAYKKYNTKLAALFALAYGLIPVFFTASSAWGDYASIGTLFIALTMTFLSQKKFIGVAVSYLLAVLFSCYSLLLLPLILCFECYIFVKQIEYRNVIAITFTSAFILFYCLTVPFGASFFTLGKPFYMFEVYWKMFTVNTAYTMNTFNLYGMIDVNMQTANSAANGVSIAFTVLLLIYTLVLYFIKKDRLNIMLIASYIFVMFATFTTRISVFVILPALLLMLCYSIYRCDKRVLIVFAGFVTTTLINAAYLMNVSNYFGNSANIYEMVLDGMDGVLIAFSIINVLLAGYFSYVVFDVCVNERIYQLDIAE